MVYMSRGKLCTCSEKEIAADQADGKTTNEQSHTNDEYNDVYYCVYGGLTVQCVGRRRDGIVS